MKSLSEPVENALKEELEELGNAGLYRKTRALQKQSARSAFFQGKEVLLFCGNDYLGLSHHPRVIRAAQNSLESYGVGAGAARLISGTGGLHVQLEGKLAKLKNKESALVFSAGYLANLGVLSALAGEKDLIVMDKLCHASLIDGARLSGARIRVFPHKNYERAAEIFEASRDFGKKILVSDAVFSMDGDLADLGELVNLRNAFGAFLVVDDAHGTGVLGPGGRGAAENSGLEEKIDCITGTLSKALGGLGGFAAGSETLTRYLTNKARPFIFATALSPVLCAAALEALQVLEKEPQLRETLWKLANQLHAGLAGLGFDMFPLASPILPLIIGPEKEAVAISEALLEKGILVPAIRTPTVAKGKARLRVTVSAAHTPEDIRRLLQALKPFSLRKGA